MIAVTEESIERMTGAGQNLYGADEASLAPRPGDLMGSTFVVDCRM